MIRQLGRTFTALGMVLLIVAAAPWAASCSAATIIGQPVLLSTLLGGGSLVSGDKTFDNFSYLPTGDMPPASSVNVVAIQDNLGNFGIRIQGNFLDIATSLGGSDALVTFNVTAGPNRLISDVHMEGNPTLLGTFGSVSVVETFLPFCADPVACRLKIYDDNSLSPPGVLTASTILPTPTKTLPVQKDIAAYALPNPQNPTGQGQTATLSFVDQTFSQITIPEPATAALIVGGALGLVLMRRRSSSH